MKEFDLTKLRESLYIFFPNLIESLFLFLEIFCKILNNCKIELSLSGNDILLINQLCYTLMCFISMLTVTYKQIKIFSGTTFVSYLCNNAKES